MPQYPELLEVLQDFHTRTRNFCEFCRTFIPVPETSVSCVRPVPQYQGYGYSFFFVPARNFCEFCTTAPKYPELLSSVTLPCPYPKLLEVPKTSTPLRSYPESTNPTEHNLGLFSQGVNEAQNIREYQCVVHTYIICIRTHNICISVLLRAYGV